MFPPSPWDLWRENVEVFVVAAIMALSIRTYFLQPFKIPTGSMEPTLFGIEPVNTKELPPNVLYRTYDFLIHGKSYSRVVTDQGGRVVAMEPGSFTIWFEYTDVTLQNDQGQKEVKRIWIRLSDVQYKLGIFPYGSVDQRDNQLHQDVYPAGGVLANFTTQTGDQVMVDKVTYNFRQPQRGEVIIFKTAGIPRLMNEKEGSEDYIKRCVGLEGDLVEIKQPALFINGKPAEGAAVFEKEAKRIDNYPGYSFVNPNPEVSFGITQGATPSNPFGTSQTYYVPSDCYFALGDNSPNSKDSRYWGGVPKQNMVGRGCFVWWPFTERWGWIR